MTQPYLVPPYPVDALPPVLAQLIREVQSKVQAPDALIGMAALSAVSAACQGLVDVLLPTGQVRPVSSNFVVLAESGERKTAVDNIFSASIHAHDAARAVKYNEDREQFECAMKLWQARDQVLLGKLKKAADEDVSIDEIESQWQGHEKNKPVKPSLQQVPCDEMSATEATFASKDEGDHVQNASRAVKYKEDLTQYMCEMKVWQAKDEVLRGKLKRAAHQHPSADEIKLQWEDHSKKKPVKPRLRQLIRQNMSERALIDVLEGDGESISVMADEGETVLKGSAMAAFGVHNRVWDGAKTLTLDRGKNVHVVARNPRLTMSIMVQPEVFKEYLRRHGNLARGSGFWARVLVGSPASTQGFRFVYWYNEHWLHLSGFHARIKELLEEYDQRLAAGPVEREVLDFAPESVARWIQLVNQLEADLQPFGYLNDIKDFASKAMEITGRIAALVHFFIKQEGPIGVNSLECAFGIVRWHIHEFKRLFGHQVGATQVQSDAKALEFYLHTHFYQSGHLIAPRNAVLRSGPIRPVARFNEVLDYMIACGRVWISLVGRRRFINRSSNFGAP